MVKVHSYSQGKFFPKMLYEDGPELEQCQSFPTPVDPNERFYDDLLNSPTIPSEEPWKRNQFSLGLPTPPTTPERLHCPPRLRNPKGVEQPIMNINSYNTNPYCDSRLQSPNSNNLQVVPESIPEQAVQEILPFLEDLESKSMSSPNFYCETVSSQQQPCLSPPSSQVTDTYSQAPVSYQQPTVVDQTIALGSFSESPEHTPFQQNQLYSDCPNETGPYPTYTSGFNTSHCATVAASMASKEQGIPSCIMSPVSPNTHMDRAYFPAPITAVPNARGLGPRPSKRVARELNFPSEFTNVNGAPAPILTRPSQDLICQFGALENYPREDGENGETELSRATHNVLERQRRNDLKMRFHMLRDNIPELMNNEKAPKIQILKKAHEYTDELKAQEQRLLADKELERQRKLILLRRLSLLRQGFFEPY